MAKVIQSKDITKLTSIDVLIQDYSVLVDEEDLCKLRSRRWKITNYGYIMSDSMGGKYIQLHRFILTPPKDKLVDHINRNKLDNRRDNLRLCSLEENIRNKSAHPTNLLGLKGIRKKANGKFEVRINGECIGKFSDLDAAKNAYNFYAEKYHKDFAFLHEVDKKMTRLEWENFKSSKTSKYKGVYFLKIRSSWWCNVKINNKKVAFEFSSETEAAIAYNFLVSVHYPNKKRNQVNIC